MRRALLGIFACCLAHGQAPDPSLSFEVASVKPSAPPEVIEAGGRVMARRMGCSGGPGTSSPGQYTCANATIGIMVRQAFGLKPYQLPSVGMSDGPKYDVTAKIPAGATREQVLAMMQNLLIERFKLTYHYEKKEMQVYELVVGKGGPKLKESPPEPPPAADGAPAAAPPPPSSGRTTMGPDGFPVLPSRRGGMSIVMMSNGGRRIAASDSTMEQIVGLLSNQLGLPVIDATGLTGKHDFTLTFTDTSSSPGGPSMSVSVDGGSAAAPPAESDAPTIFAAVQEQLGLRLAPKERRHRYLRDRSRGEEPDGELAPRVPDRRRYRCHESSLCVMKSGYAPRAQFV